MNKRALRRLRYRFFARVLAWLLCSGILVALLLFLADYLFDGVVIDAVAGVNWSLGHFLLQHKLACLSAAFLAALLLVLYLAVSQFTRYLNLVVASLDNVVQQSPEELELPPDFQDVQEKLETIKQDLADSRSAAARAEQRRNELVLYLAHDLKTPLTSVIGYLTLLRQEPGMPLERRENCVDIALAKARRLEELISEFFEVTRLDQQEGMTLERRPFNLSLLLCQLADEFYPLLAPKKLTMRLNTENGLICCADADKLARVFDNLLRNAISYCTPGGEIGLFAERREGGIVIQVVNPGEEIPADQLQNLFNKFFRLDRSRATTTGGAGLGLAIAQEIVRAHGGSIHAASTPEHTVFTLYLPAYTGQNGVNGTS